MRYFSADKKMYMKSIIYMMTFILIAGLCAGCGKEEAEGNDLNIESKSSQVEEQPASVSIESNDIENSDMEADDSLEVDFTHDYSEDIKTEVEYAVSASASLQEELENMEKIITKYYSLAEAAQTQGEMNVSSQWPFYIWDTELNSLWGRFSDLANQQTKEEILTEQRKWIAMKEEVTLESIGSAEEGGSIYPLLQNSFLEEITRNRAYFLANELAKVKGESFVMPEKSAKYGVFVDNQGTDSVYSSLILRESMNEKDEAVISIYREGGIQGSFVDNGNGELAFTSDDGCIKGIIKINGWDGANFTVTETAEGAVFAVGREFEFPFVF